MSITNYMISGFILKKAKKLAAAARLEDGEKADKLFQQAYDAFASYSTSRAWYSDCLHNWGLALFNQSQKKEGDAALKILDEALTKFTLCEAVKPKHIGAALDGGVALMAVAKIKCLSADDEMYSKAKQSFLIVEEVHPGTAAYNLACLHALQSKAEDCLKALETARDCGVAPNEEDILNDPDLNNVKQLSWFSGFISSLSDEVVEEDPKFTAEGNPIKKAGPSTAKEEAVKQVDTTAVAEQQAIPEKAQEETEKKEYSAK
ncbi:MAG: hypothetical protein HFP77_05660 [Methylococcales symbiont of Iophon sp. n. MRB-2018]|nr:MAG: hypothetical protein HFP77_05660 [Methylococcales symbiont of Iophon sp. n. MRB-2018]KAF3980740.1 MAG: hypothetical protein HFP76_00530 [Methylococcales symbiont of Iophon sp. n. MRB-2018]